MLARFNWINLYFSWKKYLCDPRRVDNRRKNYSLFTSRYKTFRTNATFCPTDVVVYTYSKRIKNNIDSETKSNCNESKRITRHDRLNGKILCRDGDIDANDVDNNNHFSIQSVWVSSRFVCFLIFRHTALKESVKIYNIITSDFAATTVMMTVMTVIIIIIIVWLSSFGGRQRNSSRSQPQVNHRRKWDRCSKKYSASINI